MAEIWQQTNERFSCAHANEEIRRRHQSNGVVVYTRQCLRCGAALGNVKKAVVETQLRPSEIQAIRDFDQGLLDRWYADRRDYGDRLREKERDEWRRWYTQYLRSAHWNEKRLSVLRRAGDLCEGCRQKRPTQVHHLSYEHVGDEFLWELRAVCEDCHDRLHPNNDVSSDKFIVLGRSSAW